MNDLQSGLLVVGAFVLLFILAYNAWRRAQITGALLKSSVEAEILKRGIQTEFFISDPKNFGAYSSFIDFQRCVFIEGKFSDIIRFNPVFKGKKAFSVIDDRIDCITLLKLPFCQTGIALSNSIKHFQCVGNKPVFIEGHVVGHGKHHRVKDQKGNFNNGQDFAFSLFQSEKIYDQLLIAIQLSDRSGALQELEFSKFAIEVEHLAQLFDTLPDIPDMVTVINRAHELDTFASQCDVRLSLNILSDGPPWSADFIQKIVVQDNFKLSQDGMYFVKFTKGNIPIFSLSLHRVNFLYDDLVNSSANLVTLFLEVAVVDQNIMPFKLLWDYANELAYYLGGGIVDDNLHRLTQLDFDGINCKVLSIYKKLYCAGMPAGSPVACRLFSKSFESQTLDVASTIT